MNISKEQWNLLILETEFDTIRGEFAKAEDGSNDEHAHILYPMIEREINTLK